VSAPKRVHMSRQHPWRHEHPDAVIVDRRTIYGNPFKVGVEMMTGTMSGNLIQNTLKYDRFTPQDLGETVDAYRKCFASVPAISPMFISDDGRGVSIWSYGLPSADEIRELAGRDLACWCPLDQPCHADVLLELANPADQEPASC
jgi:hypothetical protein